MCGARKVMVTMSPYAQTLSEHYAKQAGTSPVRHGDVLCCNDKSECGMITGMRLKNLLGVLR